MSHHICPEPLVLALALAGACSSMQQATSLLEGAAKRASEVARVNAIEDIVPGRYALRPGPLLHLQAIPLLYVSTTSTNCARGTSAPLRAQSKRCEVSLDEDGRSVLRLRDFAKVEAEQETESWCWAACVEMVNAYRGVTLVERSGSERRSQQEILANLFVSGRQDSGAAMSTIWRALNPDLEGALQQRFETSAVVVAPQFIVSDDIVESLLHGVPAVLGLEQGGGHAVVVTGASVVINDGGWAQSSVRSAALRFSGTNWDGVYAYRIHSLEVFDPWKGAGARTITAEELALDAKTIVAPLVGRAIMKAAVEEPVSARRSATRSWGLSSLERALR